MKRIILILTMLVPLSATAGNVVGGIKTEGGVWQTGIDGNAAGAAIGPSIAYSQDRYFGAIGFMLGNYKSDAATFGRNDVELTVGYRLLPLASVFGGVKASFIDYSNSDDGLSFNDRITTVGAGAAVNYPITRRFVALASASIDIPFSSYESDSQSVSGNGLGSALEAGMSYRLAKRTALNARLKGQSSVLNYDATESSWTTTMWKLGVDVTHAF